MVTGIRGELVDNRDDDEGADREGGRQLVDGGVFGRPVGRWVELRAELVGGQRVPGGLETVLAVRVRFAGVGIDRLAERRSAEPFPDRDGRRDCMREV